MIILGIIILLLGYLLFKHPIVVGIGWLLVVLGVILLVLHGVGYGLNAVTY